MPVSDHLWEGSAFGSVSSDCKQMLFCRHHLGMYRHTHTLALSNSVKIAWSRSILTLRVASYVVVDVLIPFVGVT